MSLGHRTGRFTSSGIYKLIPMGKVKMTPEEIKADREVNPKSRATTRPGGFSAPGLTYIKEKQLERILGKPLDPGESFSRPISWGNLMEKMVWVNHFPHYDLIFNDYRMHPELFAYWSGMPDLETINEIAEIKSYQPKNFALYSIAIQAQDVAILREKFPAEYWQMVSNAIINNVDYATAISYMPYRDELEVIIEGVESGGIVEKFEMEPWHYRWLTETHIDELPHLDPDNLFLKNVNSFRFKVPQEDKDFLTDRVQEAIRILEGPLLD